MQRDAEESWFPKLPMGSTKIVLRNLGINLAVIKENNTKEMTFSPCLCKNMKAQEIQITLYKNHWPSNT